MPVQLADAARTQPHVDAGNGGRNRKVGLGYLTRPAAALDALVRNVEGRPELGHVADVRRRRIDRIRELRLQRRIAGAGIAERAWGAVDRALWRLIGIAECCCVRRACSKHCAAGCRGREHRAAREGSAARGSQRDRFLRQRMWEFPHVIISSTAARNARG
jgi:hypothetical protein